MTPILQTSDAGVMGFLLTTSGATNSGVPQAHCISSSGLRTLAKPKSITLMLSESADSKRIFSGWGGNGKGSMQVCI